MTYDALQNESHLSGFRWVKVIGKVRTMESMGIYPGCLKPVRAVLPLPESSRKKLHTTGSGMQPEFSKVLPPDGANGKKEYRGKTKGIRKRLKDVRTLFFVKPNAFMLPIKM